MARPAFNTTMLLAVAVVVGLGVALLSSGSILIGLVPIIVSPATMLYLRLTMEEGRPAGLLNPGKQSWAFLYGDMLMLPIVFISMALGWRRLADEQGFHMQFWWFLVSVAAGCIIAAVWRYSEVQTYKRLGGKDRLDSPTKLWHDYVVYGSLGTLLVFGGLPVVILDFTSHGWAALVAFGGWVLLGLADSLRKLDPANLHPPVQDTYLA